MPAHRLLTDAPLAPGELLRIGGDEARHAVVAKRLAPGETVELLDGRGTVVTAELVEIRGRRNAPEAVFRIIAAREVPPPLPRLEVSTATPKGGRVEEMVEGLSQVGAASWGPMVTERGVVSPREGKLARADRTALESAKQCGRAWVMGVLERERTFDELLSPEQGVRVVVADASGNPYVGDPGAATVRLLVGPEGGFTERELALARSQGAALCRFGVHTMRIETAAVVAAGIIMNPVGVVPRGPNTADAAGVPIATD